MKKKKIKELKKRLRDKENAQEFWYEVAYQRTVRIRELEDDIKFLEEQVERFFTFLAAKEYID